MMNPEKRICQSCKKEFVIEPEDFQFYDKIKVPPPTFCPECRMKRLMVFRNERTYYHRTCGLCGNAILASYHPKSPFQVYCNSCYNSDKWDRFSYGIEFGSSVPFFNQFAELMQRVPKAALNVQGVPNTNSDYVIYASGNNNCYLIANAWNSENSGYSRGLRSCRETIDSYYVVDSEDIWESVNVQKSSRVFYSQNIADSFSVYFSMNLGGCQNCFGCINLRRKSYCFFNQQLSKEEWKRKIEGLLGSYTALQEQKKKFEDFALRFPRKENNNFKANRCRGDYIVESNNVVHSFEVTRSENCRYNFSNLRMKDSYDTLGFGSDSELLENTMAVGSSSHVIGSCAITDSMNIAYSFDVRSSKDCFGCDGLRNAQYCILNKRYTEEKYRSITDKIISELKANKEYGAFFSAALAPFAYNETIAQDNFPLTKEQAVAEGFTWREVEERNYTVTIKSSELPDHISDLKNDLSKEIIECEHKGLCEDHCSAAFRIIPMELAFYKQHNVPLPRLCPNCRFRNRIKRRNPLKLWARQCSCGGRVTRGDVYTNAVTHFHGDKPCPNEFETSYAPDRPEIVYCEQCYNAEVA